MKISIIVPMFNVGRYIEQCAVSLFEQDYDNIEYIFVDDCSVDNTVELLRNVIVCYKNVVNRVKIILHDRNKGVSAARNTALSVAKGDYIYFVDGDDWIEKNTVSLLCQATEDGEKEIVSCNWYLSYNVNERTMIEPFSHEIEKNLHLLFSGKKHWYLWLYMVKRTLYQKNKFFFIEGSDIGEDMMMVIKLFSSVRSYKHISQPLYHYRKINVDSLTFHASQKQLCKIKANVEEVISFIHNRFQEKFDRELKFLQLNIKFPLLITERWSSYTLWNKTFQEANAYIWKNKEMPLRNKLIQFATLHKWYIVPWFYYLLVFKLIYRTIYK